MKDILIIEHLRRGDEEAFKYIYERHYVLLCRFANQILNDAALSEEVVDDAIFYLWEHRREIEITYSVRAYLMRAVRNRCLNELQSLRHRKELHFSSTQPFPGGRIAETVFLPLACKPGNDILKYAERADNGAIDASEQQGQCNKQQYHACIQCEQCGEKLYFRHPAHPAVQRSGEIEEQERDERKEYNCKCQSDST